MSAEGDFSDEFLDEMIAGANARAHEDRRERLRLLLTEDEARDDPLPWPALVYQYYQEARLCWYVGAFVATIVLTQMAFEELLRDRARVTCGVAGSLPSGTRVDAATFAELLAHARTRNWISQPEYTELDRLRLELRNPYVHTKDVHSTGRVQRGDFFVQASKFDANSTAVVLEAREAVSMLVRLLPTIIRRAWGA